MMNSQDEIIHRAVFSKDRWYRYTLWRGWGKGNRFVQFIGLNPSIADEYINDPTVKRCINYAKSWGYDWMCMTNLFAYRATDSKVMQLQADPIGPDNDYWLTEIAAQAEITVACWGNLGSTLNRDQDVIKLITDLYCLKITNQGHPAHPLYLPRDLEPVPYAHSR